MSHARLSPSAGHRWTKCPAAPRAEANYPESESGPSAIDGTHSHTLLEMCINMRMRDANLFVGDTLTDDEGSFKVDQDRADRVNTALNYIWGRFDELTTEHVLPEIISEQKVNPGIFLGRDDCKGTCDVQIKTPHYLEIIDYKDGMVPVSAEENIQLMLYAVGAIMEDKRYESLIFRVQMTIIQPKIALKGMEPISTWIIDSQTLGEKADDLKAAAQATDDPNAPFVPGDWCKYCRHTACAARATVAMEKSGISFNSLVTNDLPTATPVSLTDEQIKNIIEAAPMIKQMIETAEAEALRRFEEGKQIDGLKVVHGRGTRSWAYPDDEMEAKLKKMGVPKASAYVTKLVSPAAATKLKWQNRKGETKTLSDRQIKTLEQDYVKKSEGKLTVVTESDHRKGITLSVAPLFQPVQDVPDWLS